MRIDLEKQVGSDSGPELLVSARSSGHDRKPNTKLLSIRDDDGIWRARFVGGNMRSLDAGKLRAEIAALHSPSSPPMVMLSMRGSETLNSGCLGAIAQLSADLERIGGSMVLYNLPKEIAKIIRRTKLDRAILTAKARPHARKKVLAVRKKHAEAAPMNAA